MIIIFFLILFFIIEGRGINYKKKLDIKSHLRKEKIYQILIYYI